MIMAKSCGPMGGSKGNKKGGSAKAKMVKAKPPKTKLKKSK